jgi:tetratricopeptide (TPR) repeat protein
VLEELALSLDAEKAFKAAIQIDPKMDRAWYGLGLVLVRQRRLEESLMAFKRNTELQSMSPFAWYQMARVHVELGHPDEALAVMRHLNGFEPKVAAQLERETGLKLDSTV